MYILTHEHIGQPHSSTIHVSFRSARSRWPLSSVIEHSTYEPAFAIGEHIRRSENVRFKACVRTFYASVVLSPLTTACATAAVFSKSDGKHRVACVRCPLPRTPYSVLAPTGPYSSYTTGTIRVPILQYFSTAPGEPLGVIDSSQTRSASSETGSEAAPSDGCVSERGRPRATHADTTFCAETRMTPTQAPPPAEPLSFDQTPN